MKRLIATLPAMVVALVVVAGCDDTTGPSRASEVAIQFRATTTLPTAESPRGGIQWAPSPNAPSRVSLEGSNGALEITGVYLVVDEVELERSEDACRPEGDDDDCEEFEAPPQFVDLPLDGEEVFLVRQEVPEGSYTELELEVEDLDLDDDGDDDGVADETGSLYQTILTLFPDWPEEASMLVTGTFTPVDSDATREFRVYFDAEIEVELVLDPPFVVTGDSPVQTLTVELDPTLWFRNPGGSVMDLSAFDYDLTGDLLEFEVEMERGFLEIEFDD